LGRRIFINQGQEAFSIYIFFVLWFLGGLVPHLQIFPIDSTVADRWFYLSSVGLLAIIAFAVYEFAKTDKMRILVTILSLSVIGLYSVRTMVRNTDWKSDMTLTTHDIAINPDSYILVPTHGSILQARGEYEKAEPYLKKAVELNPNIVSYWMLLGVNEAKMNDIEEAKKAFFKADSLAPQSSIAASLYSASLLSEGKYEEVAVYAQEVYRRPSIMDPFSPMVMAVIEYQQGNKERAIELLKESAGVAPKLLAKDLYWKMNRDQSIEDGYVLEKLLETY
jgi:tetratricopeptide (TPR) repeat protein